MKNFITLLLFMLITSFAFAQDVIITKEGVKINSKVTEINENDIRYKVFENLDGPSYSMKKSAISSILYENGQVEVFNMSPVQTTPIAKKGYTQYDFLKAKKSRNAGIIVFSVGCATLITGAVLLGVGLKDYKYYDYYGYEYYDYHYNDMAISGVVLTVVGCSLTIPGIIVWAIGQGRVNRINSVGYSLFENQKIQLNLAVGGNNLGLKLNF